MASAATADFPQQTPANPCLGWPVLDLRQEERFVCDGEVLLTPEREYGGPLGGELVDVSASGFRAAFRQPAPPVGVDVEFSHQFFRGMARVVWTRVADGRFEAGCMVLRDGSAFRQVGGK